MNKGTFVAVAIATTLAVEACANDDVYLSVGFGKSNFQQVKSDGWWYQNYYSHEFDGDSNALSIHLGVKLSKRFALEFGYDDLGKSDGFSGATQPDHTYSIATASCNGHCNPTEWYWLHQEMKAFTVSGIGFFPVTENLSLTGRLGIYSAETKFTAMAQRQSEIPEPYGRHASRIVLHDNTNGYYYGLGISYKNFGIEYISYPNIGGKEHPAKDVDSVMLSYRFAL